MTRTTPSAAPTREQALVDLVEVLGVGGSAAHEIGHAWLSGCPGNRTHAQEEGICELLASWWATELAETVAATETAGVAGPRLQVHGRRWAGGNSRPSNGTDSG